MRLTGTWKRFLVRTKSYNFFGQVWLHFAYNMAMSKMVYGLASAQGIKIGHIVQVVMPLPRPLLLFWPLLPSQPPRPLSLGLTHLSALHRFDCQGYTIVPNFNKEGSGWRPTFPMRIWFSQANSFDWGYFFETIDFLLGLLALLRKILLLYRWRIYSSSKTY